MLNHPEVSSSPDFLTQVIHHFNDDSSENNADQNLKIEILSKDDRNELLESRRIFDLKHRLQEKNDILRDMHIRYDYSSWHKIEDKLNFIWPELECCIYLGIEYSFYEEVKNIFFEIRNFLQITGRIKDRIYFASWLRRKSDNYNDKGTYCLALSTLVWSYTSSGCYRNLNKAYELLRKLSSYILVDNKELNCKLIQSLGPSLYTELLIETLENRIRISIRNRDTDQAMVSVSRAEEYRETVLNRLISEYPDRRLDRRFKTALDYQRGIIYYMTRNYSQSEYFFQKAYNSAIGKDLEWERVEKGVKSWLATLAVEQEQYDYCAQILEEIRTKNKSHSCIEDKLDGFCYLIQAKLLGKKGYGEKVNLCKEKAYNLFRQLDNSAECDIGGSFSLLHSSHSE